MSEKHYVFSARTTEKGLKLLNQMKDRLKVGWDAFIVDAVCAHYKLPKDAIALPRTEKPAKAEKKAAKKTAKKAETKKTTKASADKAAFIKAANEPETTSKPVDYVKEVMTEAKKPEEPKTTKTKNSK